MTKYIEMMNTLAPLDPHPDVQLHLIVGGNTRRLQGVGRYDTDPHLGDVLRVAVKDPASGNPELLFSVPRLREFLQCDVREQASLRLYLDAATGEFVAPP